MGYKDIRQATALARELNVPLLAANGATELLQVTRALGFGSQDATATIRGQKRFFASRCAARRRHEDLSFASSDPSGASACPGKNSRREHAKGLH